MVGCFVLVQDCALLHTQCLSCTVCLHFLLKHYVIVPSNRDFVNSPSVGLSTPTDSAVLHSGRLSVWVCVPVQYMDMYAKLIVTRNSAIANKPRNEFMQYAMAWLTPKTRPSLHG